MPEAGLESWLQGWGLAQRKQEEATPISMHYTAFLQNEYKTLVLSFCVRDREVLWHLRKAFEFVFQKEGIPATGGKR